MDIRQNNRRKMLIFLGYPEPRKGPGARASKGRKAVHSKTRGANVCPAGSKSFRLKKKKKKPLAIVLFLVQAPYLNSSRQVKER